MLKRQISLQESLGVRDYVINLSTSIKNDAEKTLLQNIIFQNRPRKIRCVSFNHDWNMKVEYKIVSDAIMALSGIVSELKIQTFKDPMSTHLKNHMMHLLTCLKSGLAVYGRKEAISMDINNILSEEKTMRVAKDIMNLGSVPSESSNVY